MKSKYGLLVLSLLAVTASYSYAVSSGTSLYPKDPANSEWLKLANSSKNNLDKTLEEMKEKNSKLTTFSKLKKEVEEKITELSKPLSEGNDIDKLKHADEESTFILKNVVDKALTVLERKDFKVNAWTEEEKSLGDLGNGLTAKIEDYKKKVESLKDATLGDFSEKYAEINKAMKDINEAIDNARAVKAKRAEVLEAFMNIDTNTLTDQGLKKEVEDLKTKVNTAKELDTLNGLINDIYTNNEKVSEDLWKQQKAAKAKLEEEKKAKEAELEKAAAEMKNVENELSALSVPSTTVAPTDEVAKKKADLEKKAEY